MRQAAGSPDQLQLSQKTAAGQTRLEAAPLGGRHGNWRQRLASNIAR